MSILKRVVGQNIRDLRSKRGLSQADLAEVVGVEQVSISRWESGQSMPDSEKFAKLAAFFRIQETEFFIDKGWKKTGASPIKKSDGADEELPADLLAMLHALKRDSRMIEAVRVFMASLLGREVTVTPANKRRPKTGTNK